MHEDLLSGPAEIPEGKLKEAREIQYKAMKGGSPLLPLGIWSRGCYWVETEERTEVYKYGTYWKRIACVA